MPKVTVIATISAPQTAAPDSRRLPEQGGSPATDVTR